MKKTTQSYNHSMWKVWVIFCKIKLSNILYCRTVSYWKIIKWLDTYIQSILQCILMLLFYLRLCNAVFVTFFFLLLLLAHAFCFFSAVVGFDLAFDLFELDLLWFLAVVFFALGDNWNVDVLVLTEDPDWRDPRDARIVTYKYKIRSFFI